MMVVDGGKVVAIDTPAGLTSRMGSGQTMRFRPSAEVDHDALRSLPEVISVDQHGAELVVAGTDTVVQAVSTHLAADGVVAMELRVEQVGLEDAYLQLTSDDRESYEAEEGT